MTVVVHSEGWLNATVIVAIIGALAGLGGILLDRYRVTLERRRESAAEALSDALLWLELPYRIARRTSDDSGELARLVEHMHHLQERHVFHASWLELELGGSAEQYKALIAAIKFQAAPAIQRAWQTPPVMAAAGMNIGILFLPVIESECAAYVAQVKRAVSLLSVIRRRGVR